MWQFTLLSRHSFTAIAASKQLNFGRSEENNCSPLMPITRPMPKPKPWNIPQIRDENVFRITIGPAGGDQGYTGITSQ